MSDQRYQNRLKYPPRAEDLAPQRYPDYKVHFAHWDGLLADLRDAYQSVHRRGASKVLLVHGEQGSGKSLFCRRLEEGFRETFALLNNQQPVPVDAERNLWHRTVADPADKTPAATAKTLADTTRSTRIYRVEAQPGWLQRLLDAAPKDDPVVRVLIFDNFQRVPFFSELSGLPMDYCAQELREGREDSLYTFTAQGIDLHARESLRGSIFLCLSNRPATMQGMYEAIRREYIELPRLHAVPLPAPAVKERIVRTNLNRLNQWSYWYCLHRTVASQREGLREALLGQTGIGGVYDLVDRGFETDQKARDARNVLTVVTLGSTPTEVEARLAQSWEGRWDRCHVGSTLGVWHFPRGFAAALAALVLDDRRLSLFDSEFSVRWITLSPRAAHALVGVSTSSGDDGDALLDLLEGTDDRADDWKAMDTRLSQHAEDPVWFSGFKTAGQRRSVAYEKALSARARARQQTYSTSMPDFSEVRPDFTLNPYRACALHEAVDAGDIPRALKRACHVVEFTSHLTQDLDGIDEYMRGKVEGYAKMLEAL